MGPWARTDSDGRGLTLSWSATDAQRAAWLAPPPRGLPRLPAVVSLKVALPSAESRVAVRLLEAQWVPVESPWDLEAAETASLGTRGAWRGIPYQEILLRPLRPSPATPGAVEVLASALLQVDLETPGVRFAQAAEAPALGGEAELFVNPGDARPAGPSGLGTAAPPAPPAPEAGPAPGLRITVTADGIVRADYAWLTARGFSPAGLDPRNFHLTCQGVEIPILVEGEGDGSFDPGDAVVFYGQKAALPARSLWNGGDFTDANVYWLRSGSSAGLRMTAVPAAPVSGYPAVTKFSATVRSEQDTYFYVINHLRPNGSLWYWGPFFGTDAGGASAVRHLTVEAPRATSGAVTLTLVTASWGPGTHSVSPRWNGDAPLSGADPWSWNDVALTEATWTFPAPTPGSNDLALTIPGFADHTDYQVPDYVLLTYNRTLASDGGALLLTPPNANATYASSGYGAAPTILDLSRTDAATGLALPRRLTGATFSGGTATFEMAADAGVSQRRVALSSSPAAPAGAEAASPPDLTGASAGADLLVITHADFAPSSPASAWQQWLARRSGTLSVRVVTAQDVFDNFSAGLFDPPAIRSFLQVVGASWTTRPQWVLLMGDSTWDYENRNLASGFKNTVPTMAFEDVTDSANFGRYVSDAWYADWDGDGYPDAAVGRLPVHSSTESEGLFAKLLAYEDQALSGSWYKTEAFVADRTDGYGQDFETHLDQLAAAWGQAPWASLALYYGRPPYNGVDAAGFAAALRADFPAAALMTYSGHGFLNSWGYDLGAGALLSSNAVRNVSGTLYSDVDLLPVSWQMPFVLQGTCYSSAFAEPTVTSLAEDMLDRPTRGSIGSVGQCTIGYASEEQAFNDAFFQQAFGTAKVRRTGDLAEAGRFSLPSSTPRAVFGNVLLGDPSLVLRLPAPPAPASLQAVAQNAAVALTWSAAVPAPAQYRVYRSAGGSGSWSLLPAAPFPAGQTSCTDTGLTNTVTYRYYATSVDASGFEGPPTAVASATPLNPSPPAAPSGLVATDSGVGDSVDLRWSANGESDLSGYTLWWGTASGAYTASLALPKTAVATRVSGLAQGTTCYFTLTASNTSGRTSGYAAEVHAVPTASPLAVRPPAMITDLRVVRSGADLVVSWTKPSVDVGGQATTVSSFQLFRVVGGYDWNLDTVSLSPPNARVAVPATPATTYTYTDTGAVSLAGTVTYLVVAFGPGGDRSPASTPPPAPVLGLRVTRSATTGKTLLTFPPVTTVLGGGGTSLVDHYAVYGFYPVAATSDHVRPSAPVLQATVPAALPTCEGSAVVCDGTTAPPLFYTVVAVDRRGNTSLY